MDGDGEKEIEASQRESVGHFQSAERLVSLNFYCKVHYIMCIKICRWNIFGGVPALLATIGVPALLATIYMCIYICIYIYIYILLLYIYIILLQTQKCTWGGGSPPQSGGISGYYGSWTINKHEKTLPIKSIWKFVSFISWPPNMRIKPSNMRIYVTLSYYQTNHLTTTFLVVVCCYMCNGQDMQCFAIKGNGHPVIDRELYTVALTILVILVCFAEDWCSKNFSTLSR